MKKFEIPEIEIVELDEEVLTTVGASIGGGLNDVGECGIDEE